MQPSEAATASDGLEEGVDDLFHAAADHLAGLVTENSASVPDAIKLKLYGLYKQATVGPCNTTKPAFWDRAGVSKWNSWKQLGALEQQAAMEQYIAVLKQHDPKWAAAVDTDSPENSNKTAAGQKKSGVGGPVFSTLMHSSEQQGQADGGCSHGSSSSSSIHELAGQGELGALQACLDSGAAVDSRDETGCTALHFAADRGQQEAVMLLLAAGADINVKDHDGQTALHYAAMCEQLEVCELLLRQGADASIQDVEGQLAKQLAPDAWTCWG